MHQIAKLQNIRSKYDRTERRNRQIHNHSGDSNTPPSAIDRTTRQKVSKDIREFNNTTGQQDLINICRTLHPTTAEYTPFSSAHGRRRQTISWALKKNSTNLKESKSYSTFSHHNGIKPEISNRKITKKSLTFGN